MFHMVFLVTAVAPLPSPSHCHNNNIAVGANTTDSFDSQEFSSLAIATELSVVIAEHMVCLVSAASFCRLIHRWSRMPLFVNFVFTLHTN